MLSRSAVSPASALPRLARHVAIASSSSSSRALHTSRSTPSSSQPTDVASRELKLHLVSTPSLSLSITFAVPSLLRSLFASPSISNDDDIPPFALADLSLPSSSSSPSRSSNAEETAEDPIWNWDGLLRAVPKKKVSHSRKAMRAANKGLKDRLDFVHCQSCGRPKAAHHLCAFCFGEISRKQKREVAQVLVSSSSTSKATVTKAGEASASLGTPSSFRLSAPALLGLKALEKRSGDVGAARAIRAKGEGEVTKQTKVKQIKRKPAPSSPSSWWRTTVARTVGRARQ